MSLDLRFEFRPVKAGSTTFMCDCDWRLMRGGCFEAGCARGSAMTKAGAERRTIPRRQRSGANPKAHVTLSAGQEADRAALRALLCEGLESPPGERADRAYFAALRQQARRRHRR